MPKTPQQKLDDLQKKKAQLDALIQKERAKMRTVERKQDTRRKIISGAIVLEHAEIDLEFGAQLDRLLKKHVTRTQDRALFDLPPLPGQEPGNDEADDQQAKKAATGS